MSFHLPFLFAKLIVPYRVYPKEIKTLQKDYAALWEPLSDLLKKLSEVVEL